MTRAVSVRVSNSHTVAVHLRRNHDPACDGQGSGGRDQSIPRLFRPCRECGRPPGSAGIWSDPGRWV